MANIGKVSQVIGPAVDVEFEEGKQPPIHQALHITSKGFTAPTPIDVIVEVQQHLGEGTVKPLLVMCSALWIGGCLPSSNSTSIAGPMT